jgi:hypothetical protein
VASLITAAVTLRRVRVVFGASVVSAAAALRRGGAGVGLSDGVLPVLVVRLLNAIS